jgi:hypothetical protein
MILDDSDLTMMRSVAELSLIDTCVIKRPTLVSDGHGGQNETTPTVETTVCKIRTATGDVAEVGAVEDEVLRVRISLPYDANVQAKDIISIDGSDYIVTTKKVSSYDVLCQVEARLD